MSRRTLNAEVAKNAEKNSANSAFSALKDIVFSALKIKI